VKIQHSRSHCSGVRQTDIFVLYWWYKILIPLALPHGEKKILWCYGRELFDNCCLELVEMYSSVAWNLGEHRVRQYERFTLYPVTHALSSNEMCFLRRNITHQIRNILGNSKVSNGSACSQLIVENNKCYWVLEWHLHQINDVADHFIKISFFFTLCFRPGYVGLLH